MSQKNTVLVLNDQLRPVSRTTRKNANRYVNHGRARWHGNAVQFIENDDRVVSAAANTKRYRDGAGFAVLDAIAGLPCIQPVKLITGKRPAESPPDVPAFSLVSRRYLPIEECGVTGPAYRSFPAVEQLPKNVRVVARDGVYL